MRIKKVFYALVPMLFLAMGACQEEPVQAPAINLNEDEISIGAEGGESSVLIKPTRDWTATVENGADWLTVNPASGSSADVVVEVKVVAEANEGEARSAKVTFTAANIEEVLTVNQDAVSGGGDEPGDETIISVADFLAKPVDDGVYYRLKGVITDLFNTEYGNFHLVDETGDVLVYGLTAEKQSSNDQSFSTLGLNEGDIVTIEGTRAEYDGEAQVGGPAYYISHEEGETPENPLGDVNVVLGEKAYYEKATVNGEEFPVLKLGTSSINGDASFTIPAGTTKITMYCVAWKGKSGALNLSGNCTITPSRIEAASNDGASNNSPYTMTVTDADRYEFTVSGCNSDTVINLQSEARVILWDVQLD